MMVSYVFLFTLNNTICPGHTLITMYTSIMGEILQRISSFVVYVQKKSLHFPHIIFTCS